MRQALAIVVCAMVALGCGDDDSTDTSGAGASSSGGGGNGASGSGGTGTGASGGTGAVSVGGSGGAGADCNPACAGGLECCGGVCVNKGNDIKNCGRCGTVCEGFSPFCDNGTCGAPPCDPQTACVGTATCCGTECCMPGMLCCVVPMGPVGPPECMAPNENGTCEPGCPECVCASPDTPIATPHGDRPIADLAVGDLVYSVDRGTVKVVPIARVHRAAVSNHHVVRVTLATGASLEISARHPTADGRTFGDLRAGDSLAGVPIAEVNRVPYEKSHTFDVLPASDSGAYFAAGALVGSTLADVPVGVYASVAPPR